MKNQALFSLKDKSKKLKCHLQHFLFGVSRVKVLEMKMTEFENCTDPDEAAHYESPYLGLLCITSRY